MPASDTPAPEESGGPVIHDHRRIDPVTGQVRRGKHAASKPAGTTGAGRPGAPGGTDESMTASKGGASTSTDSGKAGTSAGQGSASDGTSASHGLGETPAPAGAGQGGAADQGAGSAGSSGASGGLAGQPGGAGPESTAAKITELTADLQRLQAEYANYRKRVDRDRASVKEQAVAATLTGLLPVLDAIDQAREHGELSGGFKSVADQLQSAVSRLGLTTYGEKGDPFDPKIHEALTSSYSADVTEDTCVEILQPGYKVGDRILRAARVAVAEPATGPDGASNEASWPSPDEEGN
jgi:molecular chaperone GrpE